MSKQWTFAGAGGGGVKVPPPGAPVYSVPWLAPGGSGVKTPGGPYAGPTGTIVPPAGGAGTGSVPGAIVPGPPLPGGRKVRGPGQPYWLTAFGSPFQVSGQGLDVLAQLAQQMWASQLQAGPPWLTGGPSQLPAAPPPGPPPGPPWAGGLPPWWQQMNGG